MAELHGVETIELTSGTVAVTTIQTAVIGLVGTAPDASPGTKAQAVTGTALLNNELTFSASQPGRAGNQLRVTAVAAPAGGKTSATYAGGVLEIQLASDADGKITATAQEVSDAVLALTDSLVTVLPGADTGKVSPFSVVLSGGQDEPFPLNTPVAIVGSTQMRALGSAGTIPPAVQEIADQTNALIVIVRVENNEQSVTVSTEDKEPITGEDEQRLLSDQIFNVDIRAKILAGINAWSSSESVNGYRPRILIAPGFSEDDGIGKGLETAAEKLRAVAYLDCASMATLPEVVQRRQMYGGRVELLRPRVQKVNASGELEFRPYSAFAAGLRARIDLEKGWWWSKSNQDINSILGLEQVDEFILGDPNCEANLLNMQNVSTIIRRTGYKHWGNCLCIDHPQWRFESVRRTADVIEDSIQNTVMIYNDRPLDKETADDILGTVNAYLRQLVGLGAIFGGTAWLDEELNTAESLAAGVLYINYDFGPKSPTERITMRVRINNDYAVEEMTAQ
ncbi:TPA: phage tail sheath subtilisin-like domain-containing protein [Serratia marcescens]|nr:phage tail sheath subtilisin-like domain-containing protein [Serratia marcescens]